jgi:5-formyltetrahydrofolate cyclo-ligase
MDKTVLRKLMFERLKNLSDQEREQKSLKISNILVEQKFVASELGVYAPLALEVDWTLAFDSTVKFLYVGFKENNELGFYLSSKSDLISELKHQVTFSVPEKNLEAIPKVILIPGLAFGQNGERLGRGKGYYDRYLENFRGLKIGLTFQCCLESRLPMEAHDQYVDWVITENGIVKIRS